MIKDKQKTSSRHLYTFVSVGVFAFAVVGWQWFMTTDLHNQIAWAFNPFGHEQEAADLYYEEAKKQKPAKREVKGIYLTAYSVNNETKVDQMIDLINATELNAVVVDIKDYSGVVLYDSEIALAKELGLTVNRIGDLEAVIEKFHEHDIYVIARQTVFQDPILAEKKPEWAIASKAGGLWRDHKGLAWVDPTRKEVWDYNVDIAREAIARGFDEINFDYVRFPSDGNMSLVVYNTGDRARHDVMREFYHYIGSQLEDEPAYTSVDLFGFVMERHDGMSIGQRLEDAVDAVDYISPMMYPSHYPPGHLGLSNPAAHPGLVIENGMQKGAPYFENTETEVRPWIQAFNIGAYYGAANIRAQIDAVEEYTDGGWLLWNAANRYSDAGLLPAEQ